MLKPCDLQIYHKNRHSLLDVWFGFHWNLTVNNVKMIAVKIIALLFAFNYFDCNHFDISLR
jgi:hypothetical protein